MLRVVGPLMTNHGPQAESAKIAMTEVDIVTSSHDEQEERNDES